MKNAIKWLVIFTGLAPRAPALDIDQLFPPAVPGFAVPFTVSFEKSELAAEAAQGVVLGGCTVVPAVGVGAGFDSAPSGAAGSVLVNAAPDVLVSDPLLGLGAYAAVNAAAYPQDGRQNTAGSTFGVGERLVLPTQTMTAAVARVAAQETGFALDTVRITRPVRFVVSEGRLRDEVQVGLFTLTPEWALSVLRVPGFAAQNRTDQRESLTVTYAPGGPVDVVAAFHATQSIYRLRAFNAGTQAAMLGLQDMADGLWAVQVLAGVAQRRPVAGQTFTAPVLEAGLDWLPTGLDQVRLTFAREIDDPDQVSADAYTLTQASLVVHHELLRDLTVNAAATVQNAAFFGNHQKETLLNASLEASWQVSPAVALTASYVFNDRQANTLRAANEHVLTIGATWTL